MRIEGQSEANRPTGQITRGTRRRLRLRWSSFTTEHASLHREARIADAFVRDLARRVGAVPRGGQLPRVLQHQRWSPLNVPLLWCAAGEETTPVLEWLVARAETMDEEVDFFEGRGQPADAVRAGWTALRAALRSWGVAGQDDLTQWLRDQRFAGAQPGNHIPARAQEFLFSEACRFDARVALLEARCTWAARWRVPLGAIPANGQASVQVVEADRWAQLDSVNLTEFMLLRVPMLKSCPHFLRGQMRQCWGTALRERTRAKLAGDQSAESRAWKLFCLVPIMLLHRPRSSGSVGRDELAKRVTDFERGRWTELLEIASRFTPSSHSRHERTEEEEQMRRAQAAHSRIQRGQVSRARQELTGAALAPKNGATLGELRHQRPQTQLREILPVVLEAQPPRCSHIGP